MAQNLWFLGYPEQALQQIEEGLTLAERFSHPFSVCFVLIFAGYIHRFRREWRLAQARAEAVITIATEHEFPHWLQYGQILRGRTLAQQGQAKEGVVEICRGLDGQRATKVGGGLTQHLTDLAEAYKEAGQPEEGLSALAEALTLVNRTEERWFEAELYRLKGELTLQRGSRDWGLGTSSSSPQAPSLKPQAPKAVEREAEGIFTRPSRSRGSSKRSPGELRAITSLVSLWQQQGKHHEARNILSDIYGWFTEGFDTKDLQEAKTLLESLSS